MRRGSIKPPRNRDSVFPTDNEGPPINTSRAFLLSGAQGLLLEFVAHVPRAGASVSAMKWPWQRPIVEHRSSLTDQVVTAILQSASGGGVRPALATAAVETMRHAVRQCVVVVRDNRAAERDERVLDADWRASSVASELVRKGQCVYIIGASIRSTDWTLSGGVAASTFTAARIRRGPYRVERAGPSSSTQMGDKQNPATRFCICAGWSTPARPWAGVSPLQRASDSGSISSAWVEKRLAEEASGPVGSFLPIARYEPAPDADLANPDADDPLLAIRRDIGAARGSNSRGRNRNGVCGFASERAT